MSDILVCQNVFRYFEEAGNKLQVLNDISFRIARGERVAIVGSSGSGKTTLLNTLGGLEAPNSGLVEIGGESLYQVNERKRTAIRNRQLGFVYQFHHLLPEFDALENVAMPLLLSGVKKSEVIQRSKALLEAVGLAERISHKPAQLSGGERQRVAIARALVAEPACVLMDEPTGNLDSQNAGEIQQLMDQLNKQLSISFVVVTHDERLAQRMDRILTLKDGSMTDSANTKKQP